MKTTLSLTSRLAKVESMRVWKKKDLPGGFKNPIVLSGVLEHNGEDDYLDQCPGGCNECDEVARVFPHATDPSKRTFICNGDYHSYPCEIEDVARFYYNPDRMAELLCKALECEGVQKCGDGRLWRLGHSRLKETQGREVVVITEFGADDAKFVKEEIGNENFLLVAAVIRNRPEEDDQFNRRLYCFDELVRWNADGEVRCELSEFVNRLSVLKKPKTRASNSAHDQRVRDVAKYLKEVAFSMLSFDRDAEKLKDAFKGNGNVENLGEKFHISSSAISRIVSKRKEDGGLPIPQMFFNICTRPIYFYIFADYVQNLKYTVNSRDADKLYEELVGVVAVRKAEANIIEKIKAGWKF